MAKKYSPVRSHGRTPFLLLIIYYKSRHYAVIMGYTTTFRGAFRFDRPLDDDTYEFLKKLNRTRRMKRDLPSEYGEGGEFYVDGGGWAGQATEDNIIDYNQPPGSQPGLWCQWFPVSDRLHLEWDGKEKFYCYVEWLEYLINKIFEPRGYTLNGVVQYRGDDMDDYGIITIFNNTVTQIEHGRPEDHVRYREDSVEDIVDRLTR